MALRTQARPNRNSYRRQALMWLMMTLVLGVVTALIWMISQTPAIGARIENKPISTPQVSAEELKQPLSIESLNELDSDVQPINFEDTIRDLRNYPDEFKDKRYLLANQGKWTVQVMNVAQNEVITSYLEGREDRDKFAYFRYRDDNKQLRYMLTYGLMSSPQEAVGAAKLVDFNLPSDVRVLPEEISRYVSIIDNYERPEPIKDLSSRRARAVNLKPAQREVPMRDQEQTADEATADNLDGNAAGDNSASNSGGAESIRQSADTSATLSVNEARTLGTGSSAANTAPSSNNSSNNSNDNTSPQNKDESNNLPVVPAPKPPSSTEKPASNTAKTNTNSSNTGSRTNNSANTNNNASNNANNTASRTNTAPAANNTNAAPSNNKPANSNAAQNNDSIKALIEEQDE